MAEVAEVPSQQNEVHQYVEREHSWPKCLFICSGISMCITVDILQYSMPLAFLPSVLEDRGHEAFDIATAIGVYYWTGFLGCSIIMMYQIWRMMYQRQSGNETEATDYNTVRRHITYLIIALFISTLTLFCQAMYPRWAVHTTCRFVQGFAGAFIFFYTALLNVALFTDRQQDVAVTIGSCALNVAEVFGSFLGAVLYDNWGQSAVFWFLGSVSVVNQALLVGVLMTLTVRERPQLARLSTPLRASSRQNTPLSDRSSIMGADASGGPPQAKEMVCGVIPPPRKGSVQKLKDVFSDRTLACAVLLIAMSSVVKGCVEEMLPFHADHRWHYNPMEIGELFCIVAIAYIIATALCCNFWRQLGKYQVAFSAHWLFLLGIVAWLVFAMVTYFKSHVTLVFALVAYGICLGWTVTPANLLAASVIDAETGAAKDASNGIFQTMWEAGGSLGFLLGGLLAARYHEQMALLTMCAAACVVVSLVMVSIWTFPEDGFEMCSARGTEELDEKPKSYGATESAA